MNERPSSAGRVRRVFGSPFVRLVLLGALLLGAEHAWRASDDAAPEPARAREPIVLDTTRVRALEKTFVARWGREPSPAERAALLGEAAQEEMLYREARLLALDHGDASVERRLAELLRTLGEPVPRDPAALVRDAAELGVDDDVVIRRLLTEKMRLVLRRDPADVVIDDADLTALLERQRERFLQPATVTIEQVYLDAGRRGDALARDAAELRAALRAGTLDVTSAAAQADPLPLGFELRAQTRLQLQARFGKAFADAVFALTPDDGWSEPIASPFGVHLVRVVERREERLPPLDEIRPALVEALRRERGDANLARGLARLRELYEVRIEQADGSIEVVRPDAPPGERVAAAR